MSEEFTSIVLADDDDQDDQSMEATMARKDEYIDWLQMSLIEVSRSLRDLIVRFDGDDYGPYLSKAVVIQELEKIWEQT
jgi:hypothetical protein